ncbi:hypothetical protein [Bacillus mycoides]|uniref:hypothetical protein n=1 Tax=Bacillus mycoides TaxID=1405 RepID=UPI003D217247
MISVLIWITTGIVAYLCYKTFNIEQEKLENGKYDIYGFGIVAISFIGMYVLRTVLTDRIDLQVIFILISIVINGIGIMLMTKQFVYDYHHNKLPPFHRK